MFSGQIRRITSRSKRRELAFENSSATDPQDLLQKLVVFLAANGWTTDRSAVEGAGWTASLHKGGVYVHLRAHMNEPMQIVTAGPWNGYSIALYLGTGFASGATFKAQPTGAPLNVSDSTPVGVAAVLTANPITNYYFFSDATNDNVVVVVQKQSGVYAHFGFGTSLQKVGTWTGGPYFFASSGAWAAHETLTNYAGYDLTAACPGIAGDPNGASMTFVRAAVDSFDGWLAFGQDGIGGPLGFCGKLGASSQGGDRVGYMRPQIPTYFYSGAFNDGGQFQTHQTSSLDGRANLLPCLLWAGRDGTATGFSPIGTIPDCFVCSGVGQGYSPGSDYVIGADTYKMFPQFAIKKN
jgi:hypothetical protein